MVIKLIIHNQDNGRLVNHQEAMFFNTQAKKIWKNKKVLIPLSRKI